MVIGGGAAGLSAALVLARARRKVLVVDAGAAAQRPGHPHARLPLPRRHPARRAAGRRPPRGAAATAATIVDGTVTDLVPDGRDGFWALLAGGRRISARRLLVTTGLRDELPDIPGLRERWARDVLHCPYCHGHEVRDRQLGVLGGTPGAVRYAQIVRQWTHDLVYFTPPGLSPPPSGPSCSPAPSASSKAPSTSWSSTTRDQLRGVQMHDGCVIPRDALFVPPRFVPNSTLLVGLGCDVDADGWVTVDTTGRTSVAGVWAAGNVVDPRAQVITAAGAGSAAAIALNADLVDEDVRNAVRDLDHGLLPRPTTNAHPKESA